VLKIFKCKFNFVRRQSSADQSERSSECIARRLDHGAANTR
jgi:hypothetical protein